MRRSQTTNPDGTRTNLEERVEGADQSDEEEVGSMPSGIVVEAKRTTQQVDREDRLGHHTGSAGNSPFLDRTGMAGRRSASSSPGAFTVGDRQLEEVMRDEGVTNTRLTRSVARKLNQPIPGDHGRLTTTTQKKVRKGKVEGDDSGTRSGVLFDNIPDERDDSHGGISFGMEHDRVATRVTWQSGSDDEVTIPKRVGSDDTMVSFRELPRYRHEDVYHDFGSRSEDALPSPRRAWEGGFKPVVRQPLLDFDYMEDGGDDLSSATPEEDVVQLKNQEEREARHKIIQEELRRTEVLLAANEAMEARRNMNVTPVTSPQAGAPRRSLERTSSFGSSGSPERSSTQTRQLVVAQGQALLQMSEATNATLDAIQRRLDSMEQYTGEHITELYRLNRDDAHEMQGYVDDGFRVMEERFQQQFHSEFVEQDKRDVAIQERMRHGFNSCKEGEKRVRSSFEDRFQQFSREVDDKCERLIAEQHATNETLLMNSARTAAQVAHMMEWLQEDRQERQRTHKKPGGAQKPDTNSDDVKDLEVGPTRTKSKKETVTNLEDDR